MSKQYFGTDGIRGKVGGELITAEFALRLGYAAGKVLGESMPNKTIVIGKDTRVSGYMLESALEAGLSSAGVNIILFGPMPTPAVAWLTKTLHASAGIVISASHNPYYDNGIKFFNQNGNKLNDEQELAIEALLDQPMSMVESAELGKAKRLTDVAGRYIEFCKRAANRQLLAGKKIVLDCANGATYHIAPQVFQELGADITVIANQPNGFNINQDCGSTEVSVLSEKVLETKADLGIALDGDGDRVVMVDHTGNEVNGDQLIFMVAKHLQQKNQLKGGVVGTLMSNQGMEAGLKQLGIAFERADVGDRYVHQKLTKRKWILGGESSGHILNLDLAGTGDGIISALMVLEVIMESGKSLKDLAAEMELFPQVMINVMNENPKQLSRNIKLIEAANLVDESMGDDGRVLIRASGTEPKLRVMVEAKDADAAKRQAQNLAKLAETLGAN
ncbi:phosphoglucosamine mutase [Marinicella sp. S1101]|uniref:phosphoglucosamine mutase n=1 Tax=Marinicella marina TaxID=2996016 RepID=UPI002260F03B|nr:phosphoglucosamine mutase [Marinicella marina]MCX7553968.1 phosphoglucosamine mutase [Marinicella marina]MDJ1140460.1 phosphoglucosamine mutase [Marinicella marina]